jgi:WD40 repeat protein
LWDASAGTEVLKLEAHEKFVRGLSLSADGEWLATSGRDDLTVKLWNATTGELSHTFKHPGYIYQTWYSARMERELPLVAATNHFTALVRRELNLQGPASSRSGAWQRARRLLALKAPAGLQT